MVGSRDPGWIRPGNSVEKPAARVVCLPHSGGSAASYNAWASSMPADVQLLAVQYPGRGDRLSEEPVGSVSEMSAAIAAELRELEPVDYVLFGHSLGGLIAYETALAMSDSGFPPRCLYVSCCAAPSDNTQGRTHLATDDELWSTVCELGGVDPAIAENEELRQLFLPTLRSDIRAMETYRPSPGARPLPCPVRCCHSPQDPLTEGVDMTLWSATTAREFSVRERSGGHFHLWMATDELVGDVVGTLSRHETLSA